MLLQRLHPRRIGDDQAAGAERVRVHRDGHPVQHDGFLDRGRTHGNRARLIRGAEHDHVRRHVIVEERLRQAQRVEIDVLVLAREPVDRRDQPVRFRELHFGRRHHRARRHLARRHHGDGALRARVVEIRR